MRHAAKDWLASAWDDLQTIDAIRSNAQLTNVAAFHAQQCVEKCFKALLEEAEEDVPSIHDLVTLYDKTKEKLEVPIDVDMLNLLNQLYIEARYPGELGFLPGGKPTLQEAEGFYSFAERVYEIDLEAGRQRSGNQMS